ncbi:hypothetical protein MPTK1_6g03420 [Marchantia polymorpha subsp. ruderalis]|uniref:Uncharacterized protein n=2 Tax=Marchantia polymorpha TaxID=3197 RepID=A0AAF6BN48_MARPO|nr:hypothetical protein MARPO_0035s0122 [Marchantia polymorpha]BBN13432.1 hypothetical protein Mp_6g03420 [Marchantia polymorpha subsp. ruderalis]|eukprot:PTQ41353.1 hypothetical protein MARPO_0035s0122 [Marchantia polymorpha]
MRNEPGADEGSPSRRPARAAWLDDEGSMPVARRSLTGRKFKSSCAIVVVDTGFGARRSLAQIMVRTNPEKNERPSERSKWHHLHLHLHLIEILDPPPPLPSPPLHSSARSLVPTTTTAPTSSDLSTASARQVECSPSPPPPSPSLQPRREGFHGAHLAATQAPLERAGPRGTSKEGSPQREPASAISFRPFPSLPFPSLTFPFLSCPRALSFLSARSMATSLFSKDPRSEGDLQLGDVLRSPKGHDDIWATSSITTTSFEVRGSTFGISSYDTVFFTCPRCRVLRHHALIVSAIFLDSRINFTYMYL